MDFIIAYKGDFFAIATALVWSIAVIFYRHSGQVLGTIPLKIFQNLISTVLFIICIPIFGEPWLPNLTITEWILVLISAVIGITLGDTFYLAAIKRIGAGPQALLDCLYSPFVIFLAYLFFGETMSPFGFLGASLVILGVAIGNSRVELQHIEKSELIRGLLWGALSQLCMAVCVVMIRNILHKESVLTITTIRFAFGTFLLMLFYSRKLHWKEQLAGFFMIDQLKVTLPGTLLGPFLATLLWFAGFKYTLAGKAAVYNQLSTIFIILLAIYFLNEKLTFRKLLAIITAVIGGILVSWS